MKKRLVSSLQYELSLLYLELGKDEATYEFIKSCWLKEKTHKDQELNLLIMTHALLHKDLSFIESNLHVIHQSELKKIDQAKLTLLKAKLAEYQSRAHEGQKLQHEFEKLLLESQ
jgi:hypothetical protein